MRNIFYLILALVMVTGCAKQGSIADLSQDTAAPMASYPVKTTPTTSDAFLIIDAADANRTKRAFPGEATYVDTTPGTIGDAVVWADDGLGNASIPIEVISGVDDAAYVGTDPGVIGDAVVWVDDGFGNASIPIAIPDSLPSGATENQILAYQDGAAVWIELDAHPDFAALVTLINAAGLNSITIDPSTPSAYPFYSDSGTFNLDFDITGSNTLYTIATVEWKVGAGTYAATGVTNPSGDIYRVAQSAITEGGPYSYQIEACDNNATPNCSESSTWAVVVDTIDPVVDLTP